MSAHRSQPGLTIGEIIGSLANDVQDLVRGEIKLARAELDQKLHRVIMAAIWLLGGALVAFAGLVVVLQGVAAALALLLPTWAASLIVGVAIVVIGGIFVVRHEHAFAENAYAQPKRGKPPEGRTHGEGRTHRQGARMMVDDTSDPSRIEQDLDRTRARLGGHLTELQSRLSPGRCSTTQ